MGVLPPQWWALTLNEQRIVYEGIAKKRTDDYELALYLAWHVAAFSRAKKIPDWSEVRKGLRGDTKQVAPMTAADVRAVMSAFAVPPLSEKEKKMLAKRQARAKGKG